MDNSSSVVHQFDLNSQAGVMAVLQAIRASSIATKDKQELRDLVFAYAHTRGDQSLRNKIIDRLTTFAITPIKSSGTKVSVTPKAPTFGYAGPRPVPQFRTSSNDTTEKVVRYSPSAPATSVKVNAGVPPQPVEVPAFKTEQKKVSDSVTTTQVPVISPNHLTPPKIRPTDDTAKPKPPVQTPAETNDASIAQSIDNYPSQQYLERIRDIKTTINARVGNPVNLVDINNEIGREYMSALLEAMKQIGAGSDPTSAMARLEVAYKNALAAIDTATTNTRVTPTNQPVTTPSPQPPSTNASTIDVPVPPPKRVITPTTPASTNISLAANRKGQPRDNDVKIVITPPVQPTTETVQITSSRFAVPAVAKAPPLHSIEEIPRPDQVHRDELGDPLLSKEVDDGLDQLLGEWKIFQKSGLFGRGPQGRKHPLFMTIAGLTIPRVLSGRFEGATPEIIQSVSDYLNGWRYEQGLIYETNETFEHFLRRVIRHIIDWQKNQKTA